MRTFLTTMLSLMMICCLLVPASAESAVSAPEKPTITGIAENGDGSVTVSWEDPAQNGPYLVGWLENRSGVYLLDSFSHTFAPTSWCLTDMQAGSSVRIGSLLPGVSYWVYVEDSAGGAAHMLYERPEAPAFSGPQMTVVVKPRKQNSGGLAAFKTWSASAIQNAAEDMEYGVRLELSHGYMAQEKEYYLQAALSDPHGNGVMVLEGDILTGGKYGSKTTFFNFCTFSWYFDALVRAYGELPQGLYTLTLYLNGQQVTVHTFEMLE